MSSDTVSLTVSSRPGKKAMRNLPPTIEITGTTTVEDAKKHVAKAIGMRDFNRIAILEPTKQSIIKNRKALLKDEVTVMQSGEIMVKDLGRQISWKTVFLIEYIGPIIIHALTLLARPILYSHPPTILPLSTSQSLTALMIILHFVKREYETLYIHKFSNATMPFFNVYKNSAHYWGLAGVNIAYWVYAPNAWAAKIEGMTGLVWVGLVCFVVGELANFNAHLVLANLRSPGGTERGIPKGLGFDMVTCPNYMFEALAWLGILIVSRSFGTLLFIVIAIFQMQVWAEGKEKAMRKEFGDRYKKKAFPMIPGVPFLMSSSRSKKDA